MLDTWVKSYQAAQYPNMLNNSSRTQKDNNATKYHERKRGRQVTQQDGGG